MHTIKKQIELKAPVSKVWGALTDHRQFGAWFGVSLKGPFAVGQATEGQLTIPGYEDKGFKATAQTITPERYFSYTWHPCPTEPEGYDYSQEKPTLVEFMLEEKPYGTLLTVIESGFERLPERRRDESFRKNSEGWVMQLENIRDYVTSN